MSYRITRSRAAAANSEYSIPPVMVATVLERPPHNIISEMPPAIPIEDVPAAPPAISVPPYKVFVSICFIGNSDERVEIAYKDHNMYICEHYVDVHNRKQTILKIAEMNQIQKWLRLWFKTAQFDQHNSWKSIETSFMLLPSIMMRREFITDERIDQLVIHIIESLAILYELAD